MCQAKSKGSLCFFKGSQKPNKSGSETFVGENFAVRSMASPSSNYKSKMIVVFIILR